MQKKKTLEIWGAKMQTTREGLNKDIDNLNKERIMLVNEYENLQTKYDTLALQRTEIQAIREGLDEDKERIMLENEHKDLQTKYDTLALQRAEMQRQRESIKNEFEEIKKKCNDINLTKIIDMVRECVICLENAPECVFAPCGHYVCCMNCSKKFKLCPVCRREVISVVKVYF